MQRFPTRIRAHAVEALAVVFGVVSVIEPFLLNGVRHPAADAICAVFWSVPYVFRGRNPVVPPFLAAAALASLAFVDGPAATDMSMPFLAALIASVSFGILAEERMRIAGWCAIVGAAALADYRSSGHAVDFFWTTLILTLVWFFGVALASRTAQARELRVRAETAERERAAAADHAAAEERTRIARELHDVVAHSVSVMVVQASGVRRLLDPGQEREREALISVERIGREALAEMRRMLGVMRTREDERAELAPQPGLAHLDRLITQIREAGLPVSLRVEGDRPELPPGIDLSAYRIVQEGLTNALKHAKGAQAEVVVRYGDDKVEVEVADDGPGRNGTAEPGGHGLVGMRERVAVYGGTFDAGPRDGGGFVLRAQLPVEAHA